MKTILIFAISSVFALCAATTAFPADNGVQLAVKWAALDDILKPKIQTDTNYHKLDTAVRAKGGKVAAFVYVGARPYTSVIGKERIAVIGVFTATKITAPGHQAYVLLVTELHPKLTGGKIDFTPRTLIADIEVTEHAMLQKGGDLRRAVIAGVEDFAPTIVSNLLQSLGTNAAFGYLNGKISTNEVTSEGISITIGKPGNGYAYPPRLTYGRLPFSGLSERNVAGQPEGAALKVTLFSHHLWTEVATVGRAGLPNGAVVSKGESRTAELVRIDERSPGKERLELWVPASYSNPSLSNNMLDGRHDWGNEPRLIVIEPGPSYTGEKLKIFRDANFKGDGMALDVGIHILTVPGYKSLWDAISSMRVIR